MALHSTQISPENFPTHFYHVLDDGRVQCDVCPRECKLHEGQRGLCFVRACKDGAVVLTSYGRASGFCIDPIEKKPLHHFLPGAPVLSFGTAGCNLACKFCQNWDISKSRQFDTLSDIAQPEDIALAAQKHDCRAVAYTYNDPIIFLEYAIDVAAACAKLEIKNVAVSAGYVNAGARAVFFGAMDAVNIDLKSFNDDFYHRLCGGTLAPVLDTLIYLKHETDAWLELTTLLIPGENDSPEEIDAMTRWVVRELGPDVPMHFSAFHPAWKMADLPATDPSVVRRARDIAIKNGVRYAYCGNVHDDRGENTYCHRCDHLLIARWGYELSRWGLDTQGRCAACGTPCAGVFEKEPGRWGNRRLPVRIAVRGRTA
ncbi:AmmeMemoRadiSam system radical SAM enzyme [Varunaivibrio sulfuroxidans]|uniref:Pyruvate formate lyase activating enzyme n=1 Tax=Varunaivibrio sulfuroxidans TaxID=1773489 RepID=A0A4R3J566_9PROT|nr:AmmeMemoRadiSam system radical SAM enzyme [Varunaivibrio sulfuroxidans]TCS60384.1 pyruvate formate lyase activating enzyme [Varunaivibrio sulfuroxidans]WES30929.1 AmmeMemoRadiSam system radical SAM enzyme [Varunaivibrio sulfuroxidans]